MKNGVPGLRHGMRAGCGIVLLLITVAFGESGSSQALSTPILTSGEIVSIIGSEVDARGAISAVVTHAMAQRSKEFFLATQISSEWLPNIPGVELVRLLDSEIAAHLANCGRYWVVGRVKARGQCGLVVSVAEMWWDEPRLSRVVRRACVATRPARHWERRRPLGARAGERNRWPGSRMSLSSIARTDRPARRLAVRNSSPKHNEYALMVASRFDGSQKQKNAEGPRQDRHLSARRRLRPHRSEAQPSRVPGSARASSCLTLLKPTVQARYRAFGLLNLVEFALAVRLNRLAVPVNLIASAGPRVREFHSTCEAIHRHVSSAQLDLALARGASDTSSQRFTPEQRAAFNEAFAAECLRRDAFGRTSKESIPRRSREYLRETHCCPGNQRVGTAVDAGSSVELAHVL